MTLNAQPKMSACLLPETLNAALAGELVVEDDRYLLVNAVPGRINVTDLLEAAITLQLIAFDGSRFDPSKFTADLLDGVSNRYEAARAQWATEEANR